MLSILKSMSLKKTMGVVVAFSLPLSSCKRLPESSESNLQTLDNFSGRQGDWQPNSCGSPTLLEESKWTDQQSPLAQQLKQVRQIIEQRDENGESCIILGDDADETMRSTATYMLMSASPGVVASFCGIIKAKVKISSSFAEQNCGNGSMEDIFLQEGRNAPDYRTCLAQDEGRPVLAVQNSVAAIRHTLIRGISYLYSGAVQQGDPIEWAYMEALKDTFMEELRQYPAAFEKWSTANSDDLTRFVFSEAIDQVQCNRDTRNNLDHYRATKSAFFDTAAAKQKLAAAGVQAPEGFKAFAERSDLGSRLFLPWYDIVGN